MKKSAVMSFLSVIIFSITSIGAETVKMNFTANILDFKTGKSRAEIINNLGQPKEAKEERSSESFREAFKCRVYSLQYDGLKIFTYEGSGCLMPKMHKVIITGVRYKLKYNIRVGQSRSEVARILGKPESETAGQMIYSHDPDGEGIDKRVVIISMKDNKVSKIDWIDDNE
jgi:hypothetical protein